MSKYRYQVIIPDEATRLCIDKDLKDTGMNESQLIRLIITKYYKDQLQNNVTKELQK